MKGVYGLWPKIEIRFVRNHKRGWQPGYQEVFRQHALSMNCGYVFVGISGRMYLSWDVEVVSWAKEDEMACRTGSLSQ